jgi:beta-phosphoglucomutase-like phosphatase (HAD superfamily)
VLADTLPLRAQALHEALSAEGLSGEATTEQCLRLLPGRTFDEAAALLLGVRGEQDPTLVHLVALRAQRGYRALVKQGVPFHADVIAQVRDGAARGIRIVVRADSERCDVEAILALSGFDTTLGFMRCSDDQPRTVGGSAEQSWRVIAQRLRQLGVGAEDAPVLADVTAVEASMETADVAQAFVATVQVR